MELTREQIIEAVQTLAPADQVALADAIYLKAKAPWMKETDLPKEWEEEVARRLKEIDQGKVEMIP